MGLFRNEPPRNGIALGDRDVLREEGLDLNSRIEVFPAGQYGELGTLGVYATGVPSRPGDCEQSDRQQQEV